jgi:hypothetical protein
VGGGGGAAAAAPETAHVREMRGADLKRVCNLEVVDVDRKIILN